MKICKYHNVHIRHSSVPAVRVKFIFHEIVHNKKIDVSNDDYIFLFARLGVKIYILGLESLDVDDWVTLV